MNNDAINLYEILKRELEEKGKSWCLLEKVLYVYKRTCQYFNYDETYYGGNGYTETRRFDMTNIKEFNLVCTTWSYLFKDLADALFKDDKDYSKTIVLKEDDHKFVNVLTKNNETLLLDPVSPGGDFLAASRGFDFGVGLGKGIIYFENSGYKSKNDIKIKNMLNRVSKDYSCNYLDYLKLVKEEIKKKYNTNKISDLTYEELNEIFLYVLTTSNFKDLGIMEANDLIYGSLLELFDFYPGSKRFRKDKNNGSISTNAFYDLHVPKNEEENEVYRLTRNGSNDVNYNLVRTYKVDR